MNLNMLYLLTIVAAVFIIVWVRRTVDRSQGRAQLLVWQLRQLLPDDLDDPTEADSMSRPESIDQR